MIGRFPGESPRKPRSNFSRLLEWQSQKWHWRYLAGEFLIAELVRVLHFSVTYRPQILRRLHIRVRRQIRVQSRLLYVRITWLPASDGRTFSRTRPLTTSRALAAFPSRTARQRRSKYLSRGEWVKTARSFEVTRSSADPPHRNRFADRRPTSDEPADDGQKTTLGVRSRKCGTHRNVLIINWISSD